LKFRDPGGGSSPRLKRRRVPHQNRRFSSSSPLAAAPPKNASPGGTAAVRNESDEIIEQCFRRATSLVRRMWTPSRVIVWPEQVSIWNEKTRKMADDLNTDPTRSKPTVRQRAWVPNQWARRSKGVSEHAFSQNTAFDIKIKQNTFRAVWRTAAGSSASCNSAILSVSATPIFSRWLATAFQTVAAFPLASGTDP